MTIPSVEDLAPGEAAALTDPHTGLNWSIQRSESLLCLESPALVLETNDRLAVLKGFLLENISGNLPMQRRFVATTEGDLHLECITSAEQLQDDWAATSADFQRCNAGLGAAPELDMSQQQFETELESGVLNPPQRELFDLLDATVMQAPALMSVYEFQPEHGLAVLESEEGDWVACIRPSNYADHLAVLYPLGVVPDDAGDAETFLQQVLQLNSALTLGAEVVMGCVGDGQTLVLKAELNPRLADADDVMALLGKLTALADELEMLLDDALDKSLQKLPAFAGSDAMAMMMSGMHV